MAARNTAASFSHGRQASQLREQLQSLLPDQVGPALESAGEDVNARFRQWLDYGLLALEFRGPITDLVRRITGHPAPVPSADVPKPIRHGGVGGRFRRHPFLAAGLALGTGYALYRLVQAGQPALQKVRMLRKA